MIKGIPGLPTVTGSAQAVRAGDTLYAGAQLPVDTGPTDADPVRIQGGLGEQTRVAYGIGKILEAAGMVWQDAVQVHQFMTLPRLAIDEFQKARTASLMLGRFLSTSVRSVSEHPDTVRCTR